MQKQIDAEEVLKINVRRALEEEKTQADSLVSELGLTKKKMEQEIQKNEKIKSLLDEERNKSLRLAAEIQDLKSQSKSLPQICDQSLSSLLEKQKQKQKH